MSVSDGVRRAGLDTVSAEDAAVVVDVVDLGVTFGAGDAVLGCVLSGFDVDAVRWAGCGAQEAGDAFFESVLITLQNVRAAEALLKHSAAHWPGTVRIVFNFRGLEHLPKGDTHAFADGGDVAHDRHGFSIRGLRAQANGTRRPGKRAFGASV